ncbi:MAG: CHASE domain-containing protein [Vicinamibacterales bacterium]
MSGRALLRRELLPYLILLTALALTTAVARYAAETRAREDHLRFESTAESAQAAIDNRIDAYVALLRGAAGLFTAGPQVTLREFRAYVGRLELSRYPGIQGLGYSRRVPQGMRTAILESMDTQGLSGFRYWPDRAGDIHSILYLEPLDRLNRPALGFDMTSEPVRRSAMERATDTGAPVASGRVRLVQEDVAEDEQPGFLIYLPVYHSPTIPATSDERRALLRGHVYSPFRARDFFEGIRTAGTALVQFEVYDGQAAPDRLLYRSASEPDPDLPAWLQAKRQTNVAGRTWVLIFKPGPRLVQSRRWVLPTIVSVGGTVLSVLLFAVMRAQVRARTAAERAAMASRRSADALRVVDREKDAFLATISHELRTPLNAIVGWASMLGRGAVPVETQAHAISVIKRNAEAQARLIEDLLDMSRAVAGHLSLALGDVDARAALEAAVDALRPAAEQAGLTLELDVNRRLGMIEADAGRLQQVVVNLLSNSIKFTPRGGQIRLHAERTGGQLVIDVTDTGIGIEPEFLPHLFDRFKQADSSPTRAHSGAGLGLAIVRHLVQLHGGTIEASSDGVNTGATFTVRLPASQRRKAV